MFCPNYLKNEFVLVRSTYFGGGASAALLGLDLVV